MKNNGKKKPAANGKLLLAEAVLRRFTLIKKLSDGLYVVGSEKVSVFNLFWSDWMTLYTLSRITWPCFFSGTLLKVTRPMYATIHVYTGQVIFYKVPEKNGHV